MTENRTESVDEHWMREALKASVGARLIAPPNPAVGCVIVKDGRHREALTRKFRPSMRRPRPVKASSEQRFT